jgi:hypothetical protein
LFSHSLISSDDFDQDATATGTIELGEENPLPRPQDESAIFNKQRPGVPQQAGFDMGWRVALGMAVVLMLRRDGIELAGNIFDNSGVGVLIDQDAGGGVGHKDVTKSVFNAAFSNDIPDFSGDIPELDPGTGLDIDSGNQITSSERILFHILHPEATAGNSHLEIEHETR